MYIASMFFSTVTLKKQVCIQCSSKRRGKNDQFAHHQTPILPKTPCVRHSIASHRVSINPIPIMLHILIHAPKQLQKL